jgi:hypothetical protein
MLAPTVLDEAVDRDLADRKASIEVFQKNQADVVKERAALRAEREALTDAKIDNKHWEKSLGTGETIAAYVMAIAGGILAGRTGDTSVVKMFSDLIDQDIETQKANLSHRRGMLNDRQSALADLAAQNGDDFRSAEALRLAMFDTVKAQLASERKKFDPKGTAARELARQEMALDAEAAAALAKADAELEKRGLERTKVEIDLRREAEAVRHNKASERQQGYATSVTSRGQTADMKAKGFIPDGRSGWKPDPTFKTDLSPQDRKAAADADEAEGKLVVRDAITQKPLGKADNADKATAANEAQKAWHVVERNLKRMEVIRKEMGLSVDNRLLRGAKNDELAAEYKGLATQLAVAVVKLDDPGSIVSPKEAEATAGARIPQFNTPTGEGPETADGKQKALRDAGRAKVKAAMAAANIGFDPSTYYNDESAPEETPVQSANRAANTYKPEQLESARMPSTYDAAGNEVPGGSIGQQYLFNDVQVKAPIQAMEGLANGGDKQAVKYLQAIAADSNHPGAALAAEALTRVETK